MALGPAILLDVALNPRVQDAAGKLFNSVYSRIFKDGAKKPLPELVDLTALPSAEQAHALRLHSIEQRLASMPTDTEMAAAFASLQAEIRLGQKRLWRTLFLSGAANTALLLLLYFR